MNFFQKKKKQFKSKFRIKKIEIENIILYFLIALKYFPLNLINTFLPAKSPIFLLKLICIKKIKEIISCCDVILIILKSIC